MNNKDFLKKLGINYLLVNSTNEFLVEYSSLSENARYSLTGFSGSTGDALITEDKIYLFVDGRYHIQADNEVKKGITVVKLQLGQKQDDEIKKIISVNGILGIVSPKVSQSRLEDFSNFNIKLLDIDPINNFTEQHSLNYDTAFEPVEYSDKYSVLVTNLEEVSYLTGLRDFSKDCSTKIYAKLFINSLDGTRILFNNQKDLDSFLLNYDSEVLVDKDSINAHDYSNIMKPIHKVSDIKYMKSIKNDTEISAYKHAFERTDKAVNAIREYIETNDDLSEFDIAKKLREEFINYGAKSLSFNSIVAIDKNSALPHYAKNSKEVMLKEGSLVLIDCGAYYESGIATDITRVFVKGEPNQLQKEVYTTVLKASLNAMHSSFRTGFEYDSLAHSILDNAIEGFVFGHGLGHGIGINVHEAPPNLSQNDIAHSEIVDNMTFTIEPGLYNPKHFGVRLENSCHMEQGEIKSFVHMGYEGKLIDYSLLNEKELEWLKDFKIL